MVLFKRCLFDLINDHRHAKKFKIIKKEAGKECNIKSSRLVFSQSGLHQQSIQEFKM